MSTPSLMYSRLSLILQVAKGKISAGQDGNGRDLIYVSEVVAPKSVLDALRWALRYDHVRRIADRFETTESGRSTLDRNWPAWRSECADPQ